MAKRELIPAKQEKARERLKNFRAELSDYQETFQRLKGSYEENVQSLPIPLPASYEGPLLSGRICPSLPQASFSDWHC